MFILPELEIKDKSKTFSNAIVALLFAFYYSLLIDQIDLATFEVFRQFHSVHSHIRTEVRSYLFQQLEPFLQSLDKLGSFQNGCNEWYCSLIDKEIAFWDNSGSFVFNVQIYVFHHHTGTLLSMYPEEFDPTRRHLFLAGELNNSNDIASLSLIENLLHFFNAFGTFCFFCQKFFKGHGTQHKCLKVPCCFSCKRPFLQPNTYTNKFTQKLFCNSSLQAQVGVECVMCNVRTFSKDCKIHHSQKCCRFGWFCRECQKYTFCSKFYRTIESIKTNHKCGNIPCHFCGKSVGSFHQCSLQMPKVTNFMTKLGFIDLQKCGLPKLNCKTCYNLESNSSSNLPCETCNFCDKSSDSNPHIGSLLYESIERESFDQVTFSLFSPVRKQKKSLFFKYLPKHFAPKESQKRTYFRQSSKNRISLQTFSGKLTIVDKILNHIFQNQIFHTTFISHDDKYCCILESILQTLLMNGITPKIVGTSRLSLIEIPEIGVRFISSLNYLDGSVYDICNKLNLPLIFFPQKWNQKRFFNFVGKSPLVEDYFDAEDSEIIFQEKEKFVNSKKSTQWSFNKSIEEYLHARILAIAKGNLTFLKESFECQNLLHKQFSKVNYVENQQYEYIIPYNPPLFTRAGYAFQLLLYFSSSSDLRAARPPIHMASSKQELEYSAYLRWKFPNHTFCDAWSALGQKRFKESVPDSFCMSTKTAYYFNGCLIHGHPFEECKLRRNKSKTKNYFRIPFEDANKNHKKKLALLLENHPDCIQHTETMWECIWRTQKANKSEVKEFLRQFKEPPIYRLDPRAAVRGGINEVYHLTWLQDEISNEKFYLTDMNSSYPFHATGIFPVGEYKVILLLSYVFLFIFSFSFQIITDDLKNLYFENGNFFLSRPNEEKPLEIFGLMFVRILPPTKEQYPVLMYRSDITKRNSLPLCKLCADEHFQGDCFHDQWERSWAAVYTSDEIAYAKSQKYEVLAVYEVYNFKKRERPFLTYIKTLAHLKIRVSRNLALTPKCCVFCIYLLLASHRFFGSATAEREILPFPLSFPTLSF